MAALFRGKVLYKKHGEDFNEINPETFLKGKVVALYFSSNVEPCHEFTVALKNFYAELKEEPFEIVFISCDDYANQMQMGLKQTHGDWCFVPFDAKFANELTAKYDIPGVPSLVIIKPDGVEVDQLPIDMDPSKGKPAMVTFMQWKMSCIGV